MQPYKHPPKKKSNLSAIILYAVMALLCFWIGIWQMALFFIGLAGVNFWLHIRHKKQIETNLLKQGIYQAKMTRAEKKEANNERKQRYFEQLAKIEEDFGFLDDEDNKEED